MKKEDDTWENLKKTLVIWVIKKQVIIYPDSRSYTWYLPLYQKETDSTPSKLTNRGIKRIQQKNNI